MGRKNVILWLLNKRNNNFSRPIVRLTILGVTLGIVIMLIAVAITDGYKQAIRDKIIGIDSHIRISNYDQNPSLEPIPITYDTSLVTKLLQHPHIKNVNAFTTKVAILKAHDMVEGAIIKGVNQDFDWKKFSQFIIAGNPPSYSADSTNRQIAISSRLANKLQLQIGDALVSYFVQDPPRQRKLVIGAIYETNLPEYDDQIILADLQILQQINNWESNQVGGIEVTLKQFDLLDEMGAYIHQNIDYSLKAETIKELYPNLFQWIALFDTNVVVLMIITIIVCLITIISTFFIIILEETRTIGILKTLGMKTQQVFQLFITMAIKLIIKGLLYGNSIAFLICFLQHQFHLIKLDSATYYLPYIPIGFPVGTILLINFGVLLICLGTLSIPALYISKKISPINAIRFD